MSQNTLLSIIIPVLNDTDQARKTILSIARQEMSKSVEIIVVDDGSKIPIKIELPKNIQVNLKVVRLEQNSGRSIARNTGVSASKGTFINFLDVDCEPTGKYLQHLFKAIENKNELIFGHINFISKNRFFETFENRTQSKRTKNLTNWETELTSACFTLKRNLFDSIHGFDVDFSCYGFEDRDFLIRLKKSHPNIKNRYDHSILVNHKDEVTLCAYLKKFMLSGQYSANIFRKKHPKEYKTMPYSKVDVATSKILIKLPVKFLKNSITFMTPILSFGFRVFPTSFKGKEILFKALKGMAYLQGTIAAKNSSLVSVYITTKNRPEMLQRSIDSVLAQTYPFIEIIVSDDGSTDNTPELMERLKSKHKNIVYLRSDISKGACHARNKAILQAKGEFVTGLDDDDRFTPNRVEDFVNAYQVGVSFLCSLNYNFDGKRYNPSHYYKKIISKNDIFRRNYVGNQIFVERQVLIDNNIFFDEAFPAWQDYDFFTNLLCHVGNAKRVYNRSYIVHTDHEKERVTNSRRILKGYRLYYKKYKKYMSLSERVSLAVNVTILTGRPVPKRLKSLCIKYLNLWDLFRIIKHGNQEGSEK